MSTALTSKETELTTRRHYPRIIRRVQAVLIDYLVFLLLYFVITNQLSSVDVYGGYRAFAIWSLIFTFEPVLVAATGATIGHRLRGLVVQDLDQRRNISLPRSTVRFVIKVSLGWLSLILALVTSRHQAIHDLAARSVVIVRNPAAAPAEDLLDERIIEESGYSYPSKLRRILVISAYVVAFTVVLGVVFGTFYSDSCLNLEYCSPNDQLLDILSSIVWLSALTTLIVFGWRGKLWGCRRTKV